MNSHIKSLIAWFAERHRRRRELEELFRMDDRQLRDIGLTRLDRHRLLKTGEFPERSFHPGKRKRTD
jgi:uncharacterized protein YjiS (DUF1127 family)